MKNANTQPQNLNSGPRVHSYVDNLKRLTVYIYIYIYCGDKRIFLLILRLIFNKRSSTR